MRLEQLTFTRYLAALTVVFFHFGQEAFPATNTWLNPVITAGPIAVSYFFVLSGFIMAVAYYAPTQKTPAVSFNKWKYWLARFARIYPVYLIALVLMIGANLKTEGSDPLTVLLSLTTLQAWVPGYAMTLNSPGWSISVEMFFYLSFPLLMLLMSKDKLKYLLVTGAVLWLSTQALQIYLHNLDSYAPKTLLHEFIFYHPLMHINTFVIGFVTGVYFCNGRMDGLNNRWNGVFAFIVTAAIILALAYEYKITATLGFSIVYNNGLITPLFLTLVVLLATNQGITQKVLAWPVLLLLGEASYSLYILQRPVFGLYDRTLGKWLDLDANMHFYLFAVLLTILSVVSFKFFETPVRRMINAYCISSGKTR
ncbi:MAG: Peptidoglycan/LPS O-acetylase OafA/YrhL, contains acyltransferase and SGNH-hydrolase domains [uncultured Thiotrichaceae bacterium]|uniref:Peptidoglycan/LPS O-acetylase OafA/YrhL, contains acyltransferase and SGNH-hydrolase domains n=1 Tax=uncultured Thiotrichaceae bacterium TaxID=298394 RepID=A0A6S6TFN1_9GAMM|nr:MAG: Peptidoglycan/LPS O-acetylase OafA/YrhL, contains acyltransferase and SGNH-hydrolase domains [uncultured Thiotrichaceae bacterium]